MGMREAGLRSGAHVDASRWIGLSTAAAPRRSGRRGERGVPPRRVRRDGESAAQALGHGVDQGR
jgi:hypothetical protein